jgi:hypothetical protein
MGLVLGHAYTIVSTFLYRLTFLKNLVNFSKYVILGEKKNGLGGPQIGISSFGVKYQASTKRDWDIQKRTTESSLCFGKIF